MRERLNCPNCGAPIDDTRCPYCGAVFYDFTFMDDKTPTYIRMRWNEHIIEFRALMRSARVGMSTWDEADVEIDFWVMPERDRPLFKCTAAEDNQC